MTKIVGAQWNTLNARVIPQVSKWYQRHDASLSPKGHKIVDRAISKGTLAGRTGSRQLFEPAVLLASRVSADDLYELATICTLVPFTGNYDIWDPIRANFAMSYRSLVTADDPRAKEIEMWLSFAENGEQLGPPVTSGAMARRLGGGRIESFQYDFTPPLTLAAFSYLIGKVRELMIVWAFGGSSAWRRERIDQELTACEKLLLGYFK